MHHKLSYAVEKLKMSVLLLASGTKSLQGRLHDAYGHFTRFDPMDLTDSELRQNWEDILLRFRTGSGELTDVRTSLDHMSDHDAESLADAVVELMFACIRKETEIKVEKAVSSRGC